MPHPALFRRSLEEIEEFLAGELAFDQLWLNPHRASGSACVVGSRVPNWALAPLYFADTYPVEQLLHNYDVSEEQLRQAVASAYASIDHVESLCEVKLTDYPAAALVDSGFTTFEREQARIAEIASVRRRQPVDEHLEETVETILQFEKTLHHVQMSMSVAGGAAHLAGSGAVVKEVAIALRSGVNSQYVVTEWDLREFELDQALAFGISAMKYVSQAHGFEASPLA